MNDWKDVHLDPPAKDLGVFLHQGHPYTGTPHNETGTIWRLHNSPTEAPDLRGGVQFWAPLSEGLPEPTVPQDRRGVVAFESPIDMVLRVVRQAYPDLKCEVRFLMPDRFKDGAFGVCMFPHDGGHPVIGIHPDQPLSEVPATLAEELAHAIVGLNHQHDQVFQATYEHIRALYDEAMSEGHTDFFESVELPGPQDLSDEDREEYIEALQGEIDQLRAEIERLRIKKIECMG